MNIYVARGSAEKRFCVDILRSMKEDAAGKMQGFDGLSTEEKVITNLTAL